MTAALEGQWQAAQLAGNCTLQCALVLSYSDAPGATPDAEWEGHIRATKRRTEAGDGHKGCTGKVSGCSLPRPVER